MVWWRSQEQLEHNTNRSRSHTRPAVRYDVLCTEPLCAANVRSVPNLQTRYFWKLRKNYLHISKVDVFPEMIIAMELSVFAWRFARQKLTAFLEICISVSGSEGTSGITQLHFVTRMKDMQVKLCNHELDFAEICVTGARFFFFWHSSEEKGKHCEHFLFRWMCFAIVYSLCLDLESKTVIRGSRTIIQAKLTDLTIEDLTENTLYSKVCVQHQQFCIWRENVIWKINLWIKSTPFVSAHLQTFRALDLSDTDHWRRQSIRLEVHSLHKTQGQISRSSKTVDCWQQY